ISSPPALHPFPTRRSSDLAGKSTLMRILAGVYPKGEYAGTLLVKGKVASFGGVRDAKAAGVTMIHQELGLFPELTVAENLLLERSEEHTSELQSPDHLVCR